MAYQNVGRPRFYVNVIEWLDAVGYLRMGSSHYRTLPVDPFQFQSTNHSSNAPDTFFDKSFVAILGHNLHSMELTNIRIDGWSSVSGIINFATGPGVTVPFDGFSIARFNGGGVDNMTLHNITTTTLNIGSVVIGTYYDMPHSPDLKVTMTREMDGVKRIRTKGGADLVDYKYTKSPNWGSWNPWELGVVSGENSRVGRRIWDISFSYLQGIDAFPEISSLTNYETSNYNSNDPTADTLLEETNFYSQVIHKTNGGQLAFLFQPDRNNANPDQFAICKFDMDSFEYKQVANGVYNISLKIREVW